MSEPIPNRNARENQIDNMSKNKGDRLKKTIQLIRGYCVNKKWGGNRTGFPGKKCH